MDAGALTCMCSLLEQFVSMWVSKYIQRRKNCFEAERTDDWESSWWTSPIDAFAVPDDFEDARAGYYRDVRGDRLLVLA